MELLDTQGFFGVSSGTVRPLEISWMLSLPRQVFAIILSQAAIDRLVHLQAGCFQVYDSTGESH